MNAMMKAAVAIVAAVTLTLAMGGEANAQRVVAVRSRVVVGTTVVRPAYYPVVPTYYSYPVYQPSYYSYPVYQPSYYYGRRVIRVR